MSDLTNPSVETIKRRFTELEADFFRLVGHLVLPYFEKHFPAVYELSFMSGDSWNDEGFGNQWYEVEVNGRDEPLGEESEYYNDDYASVYDYDPIYKDARSVYNKIPNGGALSWYQMRITYHPENDREHQIKITTNGRYY